VIVGEAPGAGEEKKGEPFVGPSGMLLNEMLRKVGVDRKRVFITNALLCRAETPGVEGSKRFDVNTYLAWLRLQNAHIKKSKRIEYKGLKAQLKAHWSGLDKKLRPKLSEFYIQYLAPFDEWVGPSLMASPFDCCAPRLRAELAYFDRIASFRGDVNGIAVIPMGNFAMKTITGKKPGILKMRGSPIKLELS
jgi:uracil-DNA glycosylase